MGFVREQTVGARYRMGAEDKDNKSNKLSRRKIQENIFIPYYALQIIDGDVIAPSSIRPDKEQTQIKRQNKCNFAWGLMELHRWTGSR